MDVHNTVTDSTIGTLVQAGVLHALHVRGDVQVMLQAAPPQDPLDRAAHVLAQSLFRQWRAEANSWDLARPAPIPVRWTLLWGNCADAPENVGLPRGSYDILPATMADALHALPHRRMVLLGGPGAGKTAMAVLLALDLLNRRLASGEPGPVPVVLSLETWDAERDHLHTWLAARIAEDHPGLPRVDGRHPADRLVALRKVLPILDGLDELPPHRRRAVLRALNSALSGDDPLVLTSRGDAYRELTVGGPVLGGTAVFEAQPVAPHEAVAYLRRAVPPALAPRWEPVFEELLETPPEPVAVALRSPLLLWLARTVYEDDRADPAELVDTARFPTAAAIEGHLLDRLVAVAFTRPPDDPDRLHAPGRWNPVRARRWLAYLARHLDRRRITEIAWWQLHRAALPRALALPALFAVGIALSFLANALVALVTEEGPYDSLAIWGYSLPLWGGTVLATGTRMTAVMWFGDHIGQPRRRANPLKVGAALRSARRATSVRRVLGAAAVIVVPGTLFSLLALGTSNPRAYLALVALGYVLPAVLMVGLAAPSDTVDAATPDQLLRSELTSVLLTLGVVAPLIGAGQGMILWLDERGTRSGWEWAIPAWFGSAAMLVVLTPWGRWLLAKVSLAAFGRLPWCTMEFLRDAHRGGLLQRTGATYRFRNLRVQEHLAGAPSAPPPAGHTPQAPRPDPEPRLSDALREVPPMSQRRGFSVRDLPGAYEVRGRTRRVPLAHWPVIGVFTAMKIVQMAVIGRLDDPKSWTAIAFLPAFGLLINLGAVALPGVLLELRLDHDGVESAIGRRRCRYTWSQVKQVAVRKVYRRGRDTRYYGIQVLPHSGTPVPHPVFRGKDGWYLVVPTHVNDALPPDLEAALHRFAGGRYAGYQGEGVPDR